MVQDDTGHSNFCDRVLPTVSEAVRVPGRDEGMVMQRDAHNGCEPATPVQHADSKRRRTVVHAVMGESETQQESNKQNQRHS